MYSNVYAMHTSYYYIYACMVRWATENECKDISNATFSVTLNLFKTLSYSYNIIASINLKFVFWNVLKLNSGVLFVSSFAAHKCKFPVAFFPYPVC